jgi:hypothetical protein
MERGRTKLLPRTELDRSHRYKTTIGALAALPVKSAYIDGELCVPWTVTAPVPLAGSRPPWTREIPTSWSLSPSIYSTTTALRTPPFCWWSARRV